MCAQRVVLLRRPDALPAVTDFELQEFEPGALEQDEVLVEVSHISIDAFIRTTFDEGSFHETSQLSAPVTALGVGQVVESRFSELNVGDWVSGPTLAQSHTRMHGAAFQPIDVERASPSTYLGLLGMTTGLTAFAGLLKAITVNAGDHVVVSAAAGAVGSVACQLAKIKGATVIGIAGGEVKCRYLTETLGVDGAVDYKAGDIPSQLDACCPDGIDVYFDNVGGEILDFVLDRLRTRARVVICGAISQYDDLTQVRGPALYLRLAERNAVMAGFTVDHYRSSFPEATAQLATWIDEGKLQLPEHIIPGLAQFPEALITLFTGGHMGKLLVTP